MYVKMLTKRSVLKKFRHHIGSLGSTSDMVCLASCPTGLEEPGVVNTADSSQPTTTPEPDFSGEFQFSGAKNDQKISKFVKVQHDLDVRVVYDHIKMKWKLNPPNLIVSVTGGSCNFKMKPYLTKMFRKSLMKLSVDAGAWIITGGTNYGVMKHVGKAVQEYSAAKSRKEAEKVVTVGIASWGGIYEHQKLLEKEPKHDVSNPETGLAVLDKNHSHFILVDNGIVGQCDQEITFRAKFEEHIAKEVGGVLVSCILVQGGEGSLKSICQALKAKTPVVVVGGSGQWANILATLCTRLAEAKVNQGLIADLLQENMMKWKTNDDLSKWTHMAEECVKNKHLITVFQLDTPDSVQELDVAILQSLLLGEKSRDEENIKRQLKLALDWDRSDIASSLILTDDVNISQEVITDLFVDAAKKDNAKFAQVLFHYGIDLEILTWATVIDLYQSDEDSPKYYKQMLEKKSSKVLKKFDKQGVASVMEKLLGPSYEHDRSEMPKDALKEIFQWSVIKNRKEFARVIWESMTDQLPAAIAATAILKKISEMSSARSSRDSLNEHAEEYATITQDILTLCMKDDPKKTKKLLTREHPKWGGLDCIQMAVDASSRDVVAHPAVQQHLNKLWKNDMELNEEKDYIHLIFAAVFIFPLYWIKSSTDEVTLESAKQNQNSEPGGQDSTKKTMFLPFYRAPVTKYVVNVIFHLLFLALVSYILLFNFFPYTGTLLTLEAPSIPEWLLVVWALILSLDEIDAIVRQKNKNLEQSVRFWFTDHWNKMDILALLLFLLGFGLRFHSDLNPSRIILSLSFIVYCIRLLHVFTLSQTIGPKVVMVGNMLKDLWFFVFIEAIFLFAYGVTSQGMLYPNETRIGTAIYGIFYKPYWQIYGELFLDEINYDPTSSAFECTNNQTLLNAGYQRCPQQQEVVPVISAFYMLLANILLLNLLIAMFSYTFTKLEENTESIWKFQRYELIEEYRNRPPFPAPFSLVWYLWKLARFAMSRDGNATTEISADPEKSDDPELDDRDLSKFEQWITDTYLSKKRAEEALALPTRIQGINDRLENVVNLIEGIVKHMHTMEVPNNLEQNGHVNALKREYPDSHVVRFPVQENSVSWTIPSGSYRPRFFTAPSVESEPDWADPPLEGTMMNENFNFNAYDFRHTVDRRSYMGKYLIVNGLPRNPVGRTGVWGRGLLGRYGPNHSADTIVTRWKKGCDGKDLKIEGKRVLEFIAIKREDTGDWAIPGGMVNPKESVHDTLLREFKEEVKCRNPDTESKKLRNFFKKMALKPQVFRGYADDHRNTDNSWIESVAMNFHDESREVLGSMVVSPGLEARDAKWMQIEKSLNLFANHKNYIEMVAVRRKAHF